MSENKALADALLAQMLADITALRLVSAQMISALMVNQPNPQEGLRLFSDGGHTTLDANPPQAGIENYAFWVSVHEMAGARFDGLIDAVHRILQSRK